MKAVVFPSEETLLAALDARLVPEKLAAKEVSFFRDPAGQIALCPGKAIPKSLARELARVGAEVCKLPEDAELQRGLCWAAAVEPKPDPASAAARVAIFSAAGDTSLLELVGELIRLGCQRCSFQLLEPGAVVRAYDPPYYTVALAGEPHGRYRVFVPSPPDQEHVWIELGYRHPMARLTSPADERLLLIDRSGSWRLIPAQPWRDVFDLIELEVGGTAASHRSSPPPDKLRVPLRLARAHRDEPPSMWVLRGPGALARVEVLLGSLPDREVARLLFAVVAAESDPIVVLRARPSRSGPPAIDPGAEMLAPVHGIANLHAAADTRIEPPLSADTLRDLLAPDPDRIYWLTKEGEGFRVDSIPERALTPLRDWVEYVIDREASELEAWMRSTRFEIPGFREPRVETVEADDRGKRRRWVRWGSAPRWRTDEARERPPLERAAPVATVPREPSAISKELAALERDFLDRDEPLDHPERSRAWARMAELHAAAGNTRDAALCFAHSMWEDPAAEAAAWTRAMPRAAELRPDPELGELYAVAASWIAGHGLEAPADVVPWLDQHEGELDVRTIWLCRLALARASGGDRLGLTRTRDRLLSRLKTGLSLARDVPRFLRFAGGGAGDSVVADRLVAELDHLAELYRSTPRKRSPAEAPDSKTGALVSFELAYAYASLGRGDTARELCERAAPRTPRDPIDRFCAAAYTARVEQALEGKLAGAPLPDAVQGMLEELSTFERYKVDRLRAASSVLEPRERLDPVRGYMRAIRSEERDPESIAGTLDRVLDLSGSEADEVIEKAAAAVDQLDPEQAIELAQQLSASLRSLRRTGMGKSGGKLLAKLSTLARGDSIAAQEARIHIAAAHGFLGDFEAAEPTLAEAAALIKGDITSAERLRIIRAAAMAWSQAPRERAIAGLRELATLLPNITDSYNTNSHFCVSVVSFIDALALGFATGDLAMGEVGRRFLDEDEHMVRRRIHRDLEEL